jgi:hypothetical protein
LPSTPVQLHSTCARLGMSRLRRTKKLRSKLPARGSSALRYRSHQVEAGMLLAGIGPSIFWTGHSRSLIRRTPTHPGVCDVSSTPHIIGSSWKIRDLSMCKKTQFPRTLVDPPSTQINGVPDANGRRGSRPPPMTQPESESGEERWKLSGLNEVRPGWSGRSPDPDVSHVSPRQEAYVHGSGG